MLNLCMNCMSPMEENCDICNNCKTCSDSPQPELFLPKKTIISDRYVLGRGLSRNSESLNYIGYDNTKKSKIYIKEFFPDKYCTRDPNNENINITDRDKFNVFMQKFLSYFRSIAKLRNLNSITAIYDILEQNNTCYIIMEWVDGVKLNEYISNQHGVLSWDEAKLIFMPFLSSLIKMASHRVLHLGITPENIILTNDNKIKLTGFSTNELRASGKLIESELYAGCSALEQYIPGAELTETTDVYGYAATLFFVLSGEYPISAPERKQKDRLLITSNLLKEIPENIISAIANALRVDPENRTISFETLRVELSDSPMLQVKNIYDTPSKEDFNLESTQEKFEKNSNINIWGIISCLSATLVLLVCFGVYWFWLKDKDVPSEQSSISSNNTKENIMEEVNSVLDNIDQNLEKIEAPQLIGKNLDQIQKNKNLPYEIIVLSEEFHDTIAENCVISQTPSYGEEMYKNSTIAVNISKGPSKRALPDIAGKTLSEASLLLTDMGFVPIRLIQPNKNFPEGIVTGYKYYDPGNLLDYGSEVAIFVSG